MSNKNRNKDKFINGAFCDYNVIKTLPNIGTPQFLNAGWNLLIATNNPVFRNEYRICKIDVEKLVDPKLTVSGYFFLCEPKQCKYKHFRSRVLYFNNRLSIRNLLEVIVHEVSHLVDSTLEFVQLDHIDTELRAYMMDYYCGKIFDMLDLSAGTKKPKFMNKKHIDDSNAAKLANAKDRADRLKLETQ